MKWKGEIKNIECDDMTFDLIGEILLIDGAYRTRKYIKLDDGGIIEDLCSIGFEGSLTWAKRRLNRITEYKTRDWNWRRVE